MRLTRQVVQTIVAAPGGVPVLVWDDEPKGFGVKASPGGSKVYVVQFRNLAGVSKRMTIGRCDSVTLPEAREKAKSILAKVQLEGDPHAERRDARAKAALTMGSLIEPYLAAHKVEVRPTTYTEDARALRVSWLPLHSKPLGSVTRRDVVELLESMAEETPYAANRARVVLSGFYAWTIERGHVAANPVAGTKPVSKEESRSRFLSDDELSAVLTSVYADVFGSIVRLLALTGQRRDEVGGMCWSELDRNNGLWTIPAGRSKNKRAHVVPLTAPVLAIIGMCGHVDDRDQLFGSGANGYAGWSKSKRKLDEALVRNGHEVAPWRLHDLRRTVGTGMARLGVAPHVIERVLNHRTGQDGQPGAMTSLGLTYNRHKYGDEMRDALQLWSNHIASIVAGRSHKEAIPP